MAFFSKCLTVSSVGLAVIAAIASFGPLHGQTATYSGISGTTPPAMAAGAPLGSYAINDIEQINYFNGNLNIFIPLRDITGRGEAGFISGLNISKRWYVQDNLQFNTLQATTMSLPNGFFTDYGPGFMYLRQVGTGVGYCGGLPRFAKQLTRLAFRHPDGTETEFRDTLTQGKPLDLDCSGANRSTTFVSEDGSAATFVASAPVQDVPLAINGTYVVPFISGTLYWADGRRYTINVGVVSSITDRNGNTTSFTYDNANYTFDDGSTGSVRRLTSIVDSLNRRTDITYAQTNNTSPPHDEIVYKGFAGAQRVIQVFRSRLSQTAVAIKTHRTLFPELPDSSPNNFDPLVITSIQLPNLQSYTFNYNSYGELTKMVLPTGAAFEYDFGSGVAGTPLTDSGVIGSGSDRQILRRLRERRTYVDGSALKGKIVYTPSYGGGVSVTAENYYDASNLLLKRVVHQYVGDLTDTSLYLPDPASNGFYRPWQEGLETFTRIQDSSAHDVRSINRTWQQRAAVNWWTADPALAPPNDVRVTQVATSLEDSEVKWEQYAYDDYNNRTDEYFYTYGATSVGPLIRHIQRYFLTTNTVLGRSVDYTAPGVHIRNLPYIEVEYALNGPNGTDGDALSITRFYYDTSAPEPISGSIVGHSNDFGPTYWTRGNLTRTDRMLGQQPVSTQQAFDIAGNRIQATYPDGKIVSYDFSDRFGLADGTLSDSVIPPELGQNSANAFNTRITNMLGHTQTLERDFYTGAVVDYSDPNGVITTTYRNDQLERPTTVISANNYTAVKSGTNISYDDSNRSVTTTSDQYAWGDQRRKSSVVYDGLGRTVQQYLFEDGGMAITTDRAYDFLGRVTSVSNPHRPGETIVSTSTQYDLLDRLTQTTYPDSAVSTVSYTGSKKTEVDPAQNSKTLKYDSLGDLLSVQEDPSGLNYTTQYSYDSRGLLTKVAQDTQIRAFSYDMLGRLVTAINPESGTVSFTYDGNDSLITKTDARGIVATNKYDLINRLTSTSYSDQSTPAVSYKYDDQSVPFGVGRLAAVDNGITLLKYEQYDALGRITKNSEGVSSQTYEIGYEYLLDGSLAAETYPSGRVVKYSYDEAGRTSSLAYQSGAETGSYATGVVYASHGALSAMTLGNGLQNRISYNSRLQPEVLSLGTAAQAGSVWQLSNAFSSSSQALDNNGSVRRQFLAVPGQNSGFQVDYSYDPLDRLTQAVETVGGNTNWSQTYQYDRFGNRALALPSYMPTGSSSVTLLSSFDASTNRQPGSFDKAGDYLADGLLTYSYDAERRMVAVAGGLATTYVYDGLGRRVQKAVANSVTTYVYDIFGRMVAEYGSPSGAGLTGTNYLTSDHLGSTRVVTDSSGAAKARYDYLPFGDFIEQAKGRQGIAGYASIAAVAEKFIGKEHDPESGLDYFGARYFASSLGRWMSPDWSAKEEPVPYAQLDNPQSINLYSFVLNSPMSKMDTDGHGICNSSACRETVFAFQHPLITREVGPVVTGLPFGIHSTNISTNAVRFSVGIGLSENASHEGSQVNAVRHTLWSATMTAKYGKAIAQKIGNAHEQNPNVDLSIRTFSGHDAIAEADESVDLLNNQIGQSIGAANPGASMNQLTGLALDYYRTIGLYTVSTDAEGRVSINQARLSDQQYFAAKDQLKAMDSQGFQH